MFPQEILGKMQHVAKGIATFIKNSAVSQEKESRSSQREDDDAVFMSSFVLLGLKGKSLSLL